MWVFWGARQESEQENLIKHHHFLHNKQISIFSCKNNSQQQPQPQPQKPQQQQQQQQQQKQQKQKKKKQNNSKRTKTRKDGERIAKLRYL